ncbi:MAG: 1-deoxy-D-xylulose-5-phosphate reductoisomerase [Prolixibacteraceae bacterium]|jgi:1-deoxy-D-xylulose-5-phosphate reductoisomerase|nr:1-deoxy-D-xylulose-5-phosphate reductoisomerase [Prolixibacteraceae bacterium]MDI9562778.1 1-deoxy-D-xylulose-5-phosphate reductoisomerase [Bacteroidota bacterium]NLS99723.1 1-deoxy-D-xylulose-5-phosphate reductoisomerase [Bacteroidales bacterium]OQB81780.1 MAG: 1-deoxy-D-xylulose 5-phosphate reductoisomerase [Bacteroidetes bacterium ADurb.Bin123]HNZ67787.1 1-deoxy-D-xylulose-5-phosphate reductoisomerase [Prolixibacteraceae bacterium]
MKKRLAILGSTGSIGRQTLEVVEKNPGRFVVEVLTAYNNARLLIRQAKKFLPDVVVIGNEENYQLVKEALKDVPVKVFAGSDAIGQVAGMDSVDMVLTAMVGYSGLIPTLKAVEAGKSVAIANKETLVVAGELVTQLAREKQVGLLPVDSEHSAIFQCLAGEFMNPAEKILLTCSGGPFRGKNSSQLAKVTPTDALAHPNWEMGAKITIDSATLMNKGFEMIEAHWLFGLPPKNIEVIVHPQSIIHSMVQFRDGSMKAQLGLPDMRLPILYALGFPERIANDFPRLDFRKYPNLTFEEPDIRNFPNLALAYEAIAKGGNIPCVLNAANEIVVNAFLEGKIGFTTMPLIIEKAILKAHFIPSPSLDDLIYTNNETRSFSESLILSEKN